MEVFFQILGSYQVEGKLDIFYEGKSLNSGLFQVENERSKRVGFYGQKTEIQIFQKGYKNNSKFPSTESSQLHVFQQTFEGSVVFPEANSRKKTLMSYQFKGDKDVSFIYLKKKCISGSLNSPRSSLHYIFQPLAMYTAAGKHKTHLTLLCEVCEGIGNNVIDVFFHSMDVAQLKIRIVNLFVSPIT